MDETYQLKAIILKREAFRENDTRVVVYSAEKGRQELIARGTKKMKSKMAGHLEPITLANIMVVRGRQMDYIGSAISENSFIGIKNDFEKINIAGEAISIFLKIIKPDESDRNIYDLFLSFLQTLNSKNISVNFFILKLLSALGYKPQLYSCISCNKKIMPNGNRFDFLKGGLVCPSCAQNKIIESVISDDCIKIFRLILDSDFKKLMKIRLSDKIKVEVDRVVGSFLQLVMDR